MPDYIDDFTARLQYSPLHALLPEFRERMTRTSIVFDDGLDTLARGGGGRQLRTHTHHNIVVAPIEEQEHSTLTHEFIHLREDQGLYDTFPNHPEVVHGLYEALATHLASHLFYGRDIQLIDPTAFADEGDYEAYRHMLDLFCNGGQQQVSIYDFIDTGMKPGASPDLAAAVAKSFPDHPGLFDDLEALLQNMHVAENTTDPIQEKALREYMNDVRQRYQRLRHQGSAWRRLLGKINWLG